MANSGIISVLRSLVPLVAGGILAAAGYLGLPVTGEQAAVLATLGLAGAWYLTGRGLELAGTRWGWAWLRLLGGLMLGWPRQPQYQRPDGGGPDLVEMSRAIRGDRT
jgi:hypothetical protein